MSGINLGPNAGPDLLFRHCRRGRGSRPRQCAQHGHISGEDFPQAPAGKIAEHAVVALAEKIDWQALAPGSESSRHQVSESES